MNARNEDWVDIWSGERRAYSWNRRTEEVCTEQVLAAWCAKQAPEGRYYYWRAGINPQQPVWELPDLPAQSSAAHPQQPAAAAHRVATPRVAAYVESPAAAAFSAPSRLVPEFEPQAFSEPGTFDNWEADHSWVKVAAEVPYFWNFKLGLSMPSLPRSKQARWTAHRSERGGGWFYENDQGETSWELPCRSSVSPSNEMSSFTSSNGAWLQVGTPVCVFGLRRQPRFNNQVGTLIDVASERCLVRLPADLSGSSLLVRPLNLQPLLRNSLVEIFGLTNAPELNGQSATVQRSIPPSARGQPLKYEIKLHDGAVKCLKAERVKPRSRLWSMPEKLDPSNRKPSALQWRDEDTCLFIDGEGQHRQYKLHMPQDFIPSRVPMDVEGGDTVRWPLLVYLHGTGGGTFFTHSKKSIKMPGMQFAARHFVVVSPRCEWSWRDIPSGWVIELIQALQGLEWLDNRRTYLTGCSMGGMGAWEVASQRPELFAAVSPVAAHHKADRTPLIAQRLNSTPVYAVHDDTDDTCPIKPQEGLWDLLRSNGHRDFTPVILHGVDHCKIHEHAYCHNEDLYHWFLERRL